MRYFVLLSVFAFVGCASPKPPADPLANMHAEQRREQTSLNQELVGIHEKCIALANKHKPYDVTIGPKCERDPILAAWKKYHQPYPDIIRMKLDRNIAIFEQLQQHKISLAEATAKMDAVDLATTNMIDRRLNDDLGDLASPAPLTYTQQPLSAPSTKSQFGLAPTIHCDTHVDQAGNGSTNCY